MTSLIELSVISKEKVVQLSVVAEHADAEATAETALREVIEQLAAMALRTRAYVAVAPPGAARGSGGGGGLLGAPPPVGPAPAGDGS